jgi:hypothetical protein
LWFAEFPGEIIPVLLHRLRRPNLSVGWWLVLVCSEREVLLDGCRWLIVPREKYCWLVADKPNEQGVSSSKFHRLPVTSVAMFASLIDHQPAVLFSQNKPASSTFLSEQTSTSHQPPAKRTGSVS